MTRRVFLTPVVVTLLAALLGPRPAQADVIQFDFRGVVTDNTGDLGAFGSFSSVDIGDIITGHFSYEIGAGNPDQQPGDPDVGVYNLLEFVIDQAVVPIAPVGIGVLRVPPVIIIDPDAPPDLGRDLFRVVGSLDVGGDAFGVLLTLEAPYATVFADDTLPESLMLADFTKARNVRAIRAIGLGSLPSLIDEAELVPVTAVAEPSSMALLSIGGGALAWLRRRTVGRCRGLNSAF